MQVAVSSATVTRVLRTASLSWLSHLELAQTVRRYVCEHLGESIHLNMKVMGRFKWVGQRIRGNRKVQTNPRV